jgi:acetoin utilization protein AcuB
MSAPLITAAPDDAVSATAVMMERRRVHHVVVVDRGRLAGILSSSDLLKLALLVRPEAGDGPPALDDPPGIRVRDIMQSRVAVLRENSSLLDVARALSLGGFHALPILAADDTPVGIVTSSDLVSLLLERLEHSEDSGKNPGPAKNAPPTGALPHLVEVLRAADIYLHSGHSEQQHARLSRAVARARELTDGQETALGL